MAKQKAMGDPARIYWQTPVFMLLLLLAGLVFALGHDQFYAHLAGQHAPTGIYTIVGNEVPRQRFNTSVGTSFAFLVKAALGFAISIAYFQIYWHSAKTATKGHCLSVLDVLYSSLDNVLNLLKVDLWYRSPLLGMLALISWSIPIASIVTPATLSVQNLRTDPSPVEQRSVPRMDFHNLKLAAPLSIYASLGSRYMYTGPSQTVKRIAAAVAAQGDILSFTPPATNATWSRSFWGPSLHCHDADENKANLVWNNIIDANNCNGTYGYFSWVSRSDSFLLYNGTSNHTGACDFATLTYDQPTVLYIALMKNILDMTTAMSSHPLTGGMEIASIDETQGRSAALKYYENATLIQCDFKNSSYVTNFNFVNGTQNITVQLEDTLDSIVPLEYVKGPTTHAGSANNNASEEQRDPACSTLNVDNKTCEFDIGITEKLGYQAVVEAFTTLVAGSIGMAAAGQIYTLIPDTEIDRTVLLDTNELLFTQTWKYSTMYMDLETMMESSNGSIYPSVTYDDPTASRGPLQRALEDLFKNITISLMADAYLQPNPLSPFAQESEVEVTMDTYENVYEYARPTLWIAYGLAIGLSIIAVGLGFVVLVLNDAAYDNNFSTVLRVSKTALLSEDISQQEGQGHRPLPKHLSNARLFIRNSGAKSKTNEETGSLSNDETKPRPEPNHDPDPHAESNLLPRQSRDL